MTRSIVRSTFLWHRLRDRWETGGLNTVGIPNSPVFSRVVFREVRDAIVVRIVDGRRVTIYRSGLVELFGLIPWYVRGIGQEAKLPGARAEVRLTRAFGSGKARRRRCRRKREQQRRRMKHENGEGEMERDGIHTANTLSHACSCLYVTQGTSAKKMCVRHGVCVHFPVAHTVVARTWVRNLESKKKKTQSSSSNVHLDFSHQDVVHQFAFHRSSRVNASRFPEACYSVVFFGFLRNTNKITRITNEKWWRIMKDSLSCFRPRLLTLRRRMSNHWNKQNRFWEHLHAEVIRLTIEICKMCDRSWCHTSEHFTKHLDLSDGGTNVGTANGPNDNCWEEHLAQNHNSGKKRVHREEFSKSVRLMSVVFARQNSRKNHMRRLCTKKDAPAE